MLRLARTLLLAVILTSLSLQPARAELPKVATRFDYPVGWPDGNGYTVTGGCQFLQTTGTWCAPGPHLGVDFNAEKGENYGDTVFASANGVVVFAGLGKGSYWGNIIMIEHVLPDSRRVWTQYAHLRNVLVSPGEVVERGDVIGSIGRGYNDRFYPHLHFEVRLMYRPADAWTEGLSYTEISNYYLDPITWILYTRTNLTSVFRKPSTLHIPTNGELK